MEIWPFDRVHPITPCRDDASTQRCRPSLQPPLQSRRPRRPHNSFLDSSSSLHSLRRRAPPPPPTTASTHHRRAPPPPQRCHPRPPARSSRQPRRPHLPRRPRPVTRSNLRCRGGAGVDWCGRSSRATTVQTLTLWNDVCAVCLHMQTSTKKMTAAQKRAAAAADEVHIHCHRMRSGRWSRRLWDARSILCLAFPIFVLHWCVQGTDEEDDDTSQQTGQEGAAVDSEGVSSHTMHTHAPSVGRGSTVLHCLARSSCVLIAASVS